MELLSERIRRDGITVEFEMIGPADHGRYEWEVALVRRDGRRMELHDYNAPGEPTPLDVLGILLSVASRTEGNFTYEEWASEFDSDPENWQSREAYELQCAETDKLRRFLGSDFDSYLWETDKDD